MTTPLPGERVVVDVEAPAHGGYAVARVDGRVLFIRGAIPGERVEVVIDRAGRKGRFFYADVVDVLQPSEHRVSHPWPQAAHWGTEAHTAPHAAVGGVGGVELGHMSLAASRRWKAQVTQNQLQRLGGLAWVLPDVEAASGDEGRRGLGWRTRVQLAVNEAGRVGMRPHRSHEVIPLDSLPIAVESFEELAVFDQRWPAGSKLQIALPNASPGFVAVDGRPWSKSGKKPNVRRAVKERVTVTSKWLSGGTITQDFRVSGTGFWQVHRHAPDILASAVLDAVGDVNGGRALDLYSGAGLFSAFLAQSVGESGSVTAIESDESAVKAARRNMHHAPHVELVAGDVRNIVKSGELSQADVVVLDPPRAGATAPVVRGITESKPRKIVHVSCDVATFSRDAATYREMGWHMESLRVFDIYPLTHHVETLAVFTPMVS